MAATLFADPPNATMEEAKEHFMAAEELKPDGWKENRQFLAKSCIHLKDYSAALHWLDMANELPVKNPDVSVFLNSFQAAPALLTGAASIYCISFCFKYDDFTAYFVNFF